MSKMPEPPKHEMSALPQTLGVYIILFLLGRAFMLDFVIELVLAARVG